MYISIIYPSFHLFYPYIISIYHCWCFHSVEGQTIFKTTYGKLYLSFICTYILSIHLSNPWLPSIIYDCWYVYPGGGQTIFKTTYGKLYVIYLSFFYMYNVHTFNYPSIHLTIHLSIYLSCLSLLVYISKRII